MSFEYKSACAVGLAAAVCLVGASASAQTFHQKPLRWLTPYAAGGGSDVTTRAVAQKLSDLVGQPVVVDNCTGASGKIAVDLATRAPPDGHPRDYAWSSYHKRRARGVTAYYAARGIPGVGQARNGSRNRLSRAF